MLNTPFSLSSYPSCPPIPPSFFLPSFSSWPLASPQALRPLRFWSSVLYMAGRQAGDVVWEHTLVKKLGDTDSKGMDKQCEVAQWNTGHPQKCRVNQPWLWDLSASALVFPWSPSLVSLYCPSASYPRVLLVPGHPILLSCLIWAHLFCIPFPQDSAVC